MATARTATRDRSARSISGVNAAKITAASTGPMVAKNVVKLVRNEDSMPSDNHT